MAPLKWYPFDPSKGYRQKRPPIKKYVLVILESTEPGCKPPAVAVGYRKDGAGEPNSPYFVIPGIGGNVIAWCDCLPDGWEWPREISSKLDYKGPEGQTRQNQPDREEE